MFQTATTRKSNRPCSAPNSLAASLLPPPMKPPLYPIPRRGSHGARLLLMHAGFRLLNCCRPGDQVRTSVNRHVDQRLQVSFFIHQPQRLDRSPGVEPGRWIEVEQLRHSADADAISPSASGIWLRTSSAFAADRFLSA